MRKPFFKAVVAGMASVAMIAGMSACGRSANNADSDSDAVKTIDSSKATGDLTIWAMGNEGDLLGDFVKGFEKENPDVKVKVTAIPWSSAHDKLQTAIAAGNGPDLAQMGTTWMADFSNSFSTVPDNLDMSDFSDGSRAAGQVDGVKYGMSLNSSGTDAFLGTLPFSYSAGASLTNEEQTKWTFEDTGIKKGLNFTTSLYKDGVANVNADVSSGADIANFVSGDTPMMLQGPTAVSQINELGGDGFESKYATVVLPSMDESSGPATSFVGGCDLVTFKDSKNKQSAWKFIQWASKPEVQAEWYKKSSDLPASQKAWDDDALSGNDKLSAFGDQLKNTMAPPALSTWAQVSSAADRILEQMNKGQVTVDEGLKNLQSEADSIGTGN
ncbi:extracellular solute-binding protein [Bifidobacterium adolescentis]